MTLNRKKLFLKLANYTNSPKIINVDEFVGEYDCLTLGNGGSWCRRSAWKNYKVATLKRNGKINYLWNDVSEIDKELVKKEFSKYPTTKGTKIQYIGIFGLQNANTQRPIRQDIKDYWKKHPCCVCARTSDLVCDHKNDLYNDPRVLNKDTQNINDFQSLCNQCNLQKRQVIKKVKKPRKRYGATNIPMLKIFNIDFISGDETYNPQDINAMVGTYWYDPVAFMSEIYTILSKKSCIT